MFETLENVLETSSERSVDKGNRKIIGSVKESPIDTNGMKLVPLLGYKRI